MLVKEIEDSLIMNVICKWNDWFKEHSKESARTRREFGFIYYILFLLTI